MGKGNILYKKPFITAGLFLFLGIVSIGLGNVLKNSTGDMDYFALIAFGVLFIIVSLVVFAVYGAMEMKFKSVVNDQKLLDFTLNNDLFNNTAEKTSEEIISTNKGLLIIMLAFCAGFGLLSLVFFEDGIILFSIFIGLGIFLTLMALIITKYRTNKIKKGSRRVILAKKAAYVAGEFHNWDMPGTALTGVRFIPRDGNSNKLCNIEIKYSTITIPGPSEYTFVVPIPYEIENRAQEIVSILLQQ